MKYFALSCSVITMAACQLGSTPCFADYADEVLADTPLAYYRFEEATDAETVLDSSGQDHHSLEFENALLGMPGRVGNGVHFNGDGSILLDFDMDPANPQGPTEFDFSIEMFVQSTGIPTQVMAAQQDGDGLGRSNLILTTDGEWGSFIGGSTTSSAVVPDADAWYHFVMVYDGEFEEISYYVDGEETADPIVQTIESADGNWVLGSHKNRGVQFVDGILDEVAFYNYRLDDPNGDDDLADSRVAAHFAAAPDLSAGLLGDCDNSLTLDAADLGCVATLEQRDAVLAALNTVPGDLDGNGKVEFSDFLTLSGNFGTAAVSYADGNVDLADGVGFSDFLALSSNFGKTAAPAASVPEPNTFALVPLIVCLGWFRQWS